MALCGQAYDIARSCSVRFIKPYHNSNTLVKVRNYFVPDGTSVLPFLHSFGNPDWLDFKDEPSPQGSGVGFVQNPSTYNKGFPPPTWRAGGTTCNTADQWLNGCDIDVDDPIPVDEFGWANCCIQLPAIYFPSIREIGLFGGSPSAGTFLNLSGSLSNGHLGFISETTGMGAASSLGLTAHVPSTGHLILTGQDVSAGHLILSGQLSSGNLGWITPVQAVAAVGSLGLAGHVLGTGHLGLGSPDVNSANLILDSVTTVPDGSLIWDSEALSHAVKALGHLTLAQDTPQAANLILDADALANYTRSLGVLGLVDNLPKSSKLVFDSEALANYTRSLGSLVLESEPLARFTESMGVIGLDGVVILGHLVLDTGVHAGGELGLDSPPLAAPTPPDGYIGLAGELGTGELGLHPRTVDEIFGLNEEHGELGVTGQQNWVCPDGVYTVLAECYGQGGDSTRYIVDEGASGGGGGAYASSYVAVTPGVTYGLYYPGPSFFEQPTFGTPIVMAATAPIVPIDGGVGIGGQATDCVGDVRFSGGDGGLRDTTGGGAGGGGGGCAGPDGPGGNGGDAAGTVGGTAGVGGGGAAGDGGIGGSAGDSNPYPGNLAGGGPGGGSIDNFSGSSGAAGFVKITW